MNSARELLQFDFNVSTFTRRTPQRIRIPQQMRIALEDVMQRHGDTEHEPPNRKSLRQIYRLFFDAHRTGRLRSEFDSLRRTRQLAWTLTYSEGKLPRIVDAPQLSIALQLIEDRFCISALPGVFDALLQAWDTLNAERLRVFVGRHLTDYEGRRTFVQKLKANMRWYCEENSTTQFAKTLLRSQEKLSEVWKYLELPDRTYSYPYFGAVAQAYIALNRRVDRETVADIVEFVVRHNNDRTSRAVLSKLIESLGYDAPEHLRQPLQSYALRKWEDPRITGADVRWRGVSDEAKQIFTRWITKEDLRFFFDVVAKACDDNKFAYRKAFWLAFLEHISFCRPVLRQNAEDLFRNDPQTLQYYQERQPATLRGGNSWHHAFIIQIGDYTFVEFSTDGACYIYDNANLPFQLGNSEYHIIDLKDQLWATYRMIHHYSEGYYWQEKLASWIKSELRINPLRGYRLEG